MPHNTTRALSERRADEHRADERLPDERHAEERHAEEQRSAGRRKRDDSARDITARADEDHVDESCLDKSRARKPAHTTRTGQRLVRQQQHIGRAQATRQHAQLGARGGHDMEEWAIRYSYTPCHRVDGCIMCR